MNYAQLRNALKLDSGSLTIASSTLTPNIADLLAECNGGQPLVISNASPGPGDDVNETVVVRGQSAFLNVANLPVEVRGIIDGNGNAQLFLKYTLRGDTSGPGGWHFSNSFPALPKVVDWNQTTDDAQTIPLDDLPLFNSYFVVVSQKQIEPEFQVELKPGINFVSRVGPADILDIVESIFGHSLPFNVYGTIHLPKAADVTPALESSQFPWELENPVPGILLQADLGLETAIGPMKFDDLYLRVYSPTTDEWLQHNDTYKPVMAFTGKLNVPSANLKLDVVAPMEPGSTELLLLGNFEGVSVAKLEDLIDLAGTGDLLSRLPDQLKQAGSALGKLELTHAAISRSLVASEPGIDWVSFTIGLPERKWQVWADHFEIDSLVCRFEETDPFNRAPADNGGPPPGRPKFEVSVAGAFQIEGVPLNMRASNREGFNVYAELADKQTIPLTQLMHTFVPGVPAPGDLTIDTLRMSVEPHKSYSMALAVSDDWKIPFGTSDLSVDEVYLSIQHTADGKNDVELHGNLNIAGVQVAIDASHTDGSWKLQGKTDDQQSISFTHLLDELLKPCGISVPSNLPAGVLDLSFKNLSIAYDSASKDFHFSGESMARIPVIFGNAAPRGAHTELDLQITTDAKTGKRKYSGYLKSEITLGGAPFKCEYDFGNGSMITATWNGEDGKNGSLSFADLPGAHGIEHTLRVPDGLSLELKRAAFEYDFGNGKMILAAESNHGQAFFVASNARGQWDFVFGIHIPSFPSVGGLSLKDSVLLLSTVQDDKFVVPSLPDMTTPDPGPPAALSSFPTIGTHRLKLQPGVTVAALLDLSSNPVLSLFDKSVLNKKELLIQVAIGDGLSSVSFLSYLEGSLTLDMGVEKLVLSDSYVQIDATPTAFGISVAGTTLIPFNHVTLQATGALVLSDAAMNARFDVKAQDDGKPTSLPMPFGLRGVSLDELGVEVGVIFEPPGVDLGIEGKFHIKGQTSSANNFIIVLDPKTGLPNPIYLSAYVQSLTISDLIMAVSGEDVSGDIPGFIKSIEGEELSVYWSETAGTPLPDGRLAQQGFGFNGIITIGGFGVHAALTADAAGVSGDAEMSPIHLGNIFSLEGSGKGVTIKQVFIPPNDLDKWGIASTDQNKKDGAWIPITVLPAPKDKAITRDYSVIDPGGATIAFNTTHSPHLDVSAKVTLFNLISEEVEITVTDTGFSFKQKLSVGSAFRGELDCTFDTDKSSSKVTFTADANFDLDIQGDVSLTIPDLGIDLGTVSFDVSFNTQLHVDVHMDPSDIKSLSFGLDVDGDFEFEGIHMTMPSLHISEDFDSFEQLPGKIVTQIEDHAQEVFKELLDAGNHLAALAKKEAEKLAGEAAKEAKKIGAAAEEQAEKIGADAKAAYDNAGKAAREAEAKAAELAKSAQETLDDAGKEVTKIGDEAAAAAKPLTDAAKQIADEAEKEIGNIENALGQEVTQIGEEAQKAFAAAEKAAGEIMAGANAAASAIKDAAKAAGDAIVSGAKEAAKAMEHEAEEIGNDLAGGAEKVVGWVEDTGSSSC